MSVANEIQTLSPMSPLAVGAATVHRLLGRAHGNPPFGIGVSEHAPGVVDLDLNYDEAVYLLEGDLVIVSDGVRHVAKLGELIWMPRGRAIQYVVERGCKYLYVTSPAGPNG